MNPIGERCNSIGFDLAPIGEENQKPKTQKRQTKRCRSLCCSRVRDWPSVQLGEQSATALGDG